MGFCSALRRRETEHTETRKGFGLERVASCGRSEQWWGAKLDHRWISQQHYAARLLALVSKTQLQAKLDLPRSRSAVGPPHFRS